jgi:hypothetical protein
MGSACSRHREKRMHGAFWWGNVGRGSLGRPNHRPEINIRLELEENGMARKTALFWAVTQRVIVNLYRRFRTTYRSLLGSSRRWDGLSYTETSVRNYHDTA